MLTGEGQPQKAVLDVTYMWVFWSEHYKVTAAVTDDGELKTHTIILPDIFIQSKKSIELRNILILILNWPQFNVR